MDLLFLTLVKNGHFTVENMSNWPCLTLSLLLYSAHQFSQAIMEERITFEALEQSLLYCLP